MRERMKKSQEHVFYFGNICMSMLSFTGELFDIQCIVSVFVEDIMTHVALEYSKSNVLFHLLPLNPVACNLVLSRDVEVLGARSRSTFLRDVFQILNENAATCLRLLKNAQEARHEQGRERAG